MKVYEVYKNNKERICIIKGDTMDGKNRCSNCVYWKFGKCTITDKPKHDKICDCGMFKQKAESK